MGAEGGRITPCSLLASEPQIRALLGDKRSFELDVTFKFKLNWTRAFFQCLEVTRNLLCLPKAHTCPGLGGRSESLQSTTDRSSRGGSR